jgi:Trp operon repressor
MQNQNKVDPRTAIINALLTGPKTQRELKREVTEQGVPPSTYHYVLHQMI